MAILVPFRHTVAGILIVGSIAACGPGATPTPSPSPSQSMPAVETPSPTASEVASPSATPAGATTVYVVRKGDTLIAIAKRFHVTVVALKKANPQVTDPTKLRIGQKLNIPAAS